MRNNKNNTKWIFALVVFCALAVLGLYLRGMQEIALNRFLVKWLSVAFVALLMSAIVVISVLWTKVNGEARYREGHSIAMRSRMLPTHAPYRSSTPVQGFGDWPAPPPPEQKPRLRMLPDAIFTDMSDTPSWE